MINVLLIELGDISRSQWRKLELAMKFINTSKAEAVRKKSMKLDVRPADVLEEIVNAGEDEEKKTIHHKDPPSTLLTPVVVNQVIRKSPCDCGGQKKLQLLEKRDSFSKLLDSFGKIM